jgi:hypothetical protein
MNRCSFMKCLTAATAAAVLPFDKAGAQARKAKNVVLVHGLFADVRAGQV